MAGADRYVVLGVAQVRAPWFRSVARWATESSLPIEYLKAVSVEEVRVRLGAGRAYSCLLVDDALVGLDRDLVAHANDVGCAVVVVDSGRSARSWADLGAAAVLPSSFGREELHAALKQVAQPIARTEGARTAAASLDPTGFRGHLVAVTGGGGTGRSTIAAALAQGIATDARNRDRVCLADLCLDAEQALLHGAGDVVPGLLELVDAHRTGTPGGDAVRELTWRVHERGYQLLLGLRRHRDWTAVRPRAFTAGLDGLRRAFRIVVADVDPDVEGEADTGSVDIEDRNAIARATLTTADLVVVVGLPGMKGLHTMLRTTRDLLAHGVPGGRLVPVVNRAPKGARARSELTAAFGDLLGGRATGMPSPIHLPSRRRLDEALRDGVRLPESWAAGASRTIQAVLDAMEPAPDPSDPEEPVPVAPGSLGTWTTEG